MVVLLATGQKKDIKFAKFKAAWRKNNQHNGTYPGAIYPAERVSIGKMTYGEINVFGFDRPDTILSIGNFCSLAGEVQFWIGGEHPTKFISTFRLHIKWAGQSVFIQTWHLKVLLLLKMMFGLEKEQSFYQECALDKVLSLEQVQSLQKIFRHIVFMLEIGF